MPARRWVEVNNTRNNNYSDNPSVISRIMLRFRPIAPKPAGSEATAADQERVSLAGRRTKRKYVRVRGRSSRKSKQCVVRVRKMEKTSPTENSDVEDAPAPVKEVVTLQLLPERSEKAVDREEEEEELKSSAAAEGVVIQTWIVVETVTEKQSDGDGEGEGVGLRFWDMEKIKELERDTCPGFVTDGTNKVVWVNEAYRRMVGRGERGLAVVQGELPQGSSWFACRVRIVEAQGQKWKNRIVPCDVWRTGSGLAWKLDLNTALTLSLTLSL